MAVNCWQYAREVYLVGRSVKFRPFTEAEREAVIDFVKKMAGTRPAYVPYINLKADNPPANEFEGEGNERALVWSGLELQNDYALGKMVQRIGRSLKIQFCTAEEKELCDALFEATDVTVEGEDSSSTEDDITLRRFEKYDVDPALYEESGESSGAAEESSSSEG